ncbi:MAG TPA: hypothetical protein PKL10_11925, partial [Nitrospira sp.]|nr:hypothetical protein [Nitrospira sp.]
MRSVRSGPRKLNKHRSQAAWKLLLGVMLPSVCVGAFSVASAAPELHGAAHNQPAWAEQLKGQTIIEDAQEGHVERTAMMERQHQRIMEKINEQLIHDAEVQRTGGQYNNVNMLHQYGAGNQDLLLMSNSGAEPVSSMGGKCPASAPVRSYDVSAINVEITLNMWLDFY